MRLHFYPEGSMKRLCKSPYLDGPEERRNPSEHRCRPCEMILESVSRETLHK